MAEAGDKRGSKPELVCGHSHLSVQSPAKGKGLPYRLFEALRALSISHTYQLITIVLACGIALFLGGNRVWQAGAFAALRLAVMTLTAPQAGIALTTISLISWSAMLVVMVFSAARGWSKAQRTASQGGTVTGSPPLIARALAAAVAVVVTHGLVQRIHPTTIPYSIVWIVVWLLVSGVLLWALWRSPLQAGWLTLMLSDVGRLLYALWQPNVWAWGLWSVCDVLVAWIAVYLSEVGQSATASCAPGDAE